MRKFFALAAIVLSITMLVHTQTSAQNARPVVDMPSWLIGKLAGEQRVTDRPAWKPAGLEANITSAGTWEIDLRTPSGPQVIQGSVVAITASTATLKGKYTSGSNYGKEVTYTLRRQDDIIKGAVTADWITMNIEVTLQQKKSATDQ